MSGSSCKGQEALGALSKLIGGEGWLLSVKIAAHCVEMTCDFANVDPGLDGERTLVFGGVTDLHLNYNQSVFSANEDDISTIDVMKLRDTGHTEGGRGHISFEFSYGTLQFQFEHVDIS